MARELWVSVSGFRLDCARLVAFVLAAVGYFQAWKANHEICIWSALIAKFPLHCVLIALVGRPLGRVLESRDFSLSLSRSILAAIVGLCPRLCIVDFVYSVQGGLGAFS